MRQEVQRGIAALRSLVEPCERLAYALEGMSEGGDFEKLLGWRSPYARSAQARDRFACRDKRVCETVERFFASDRSPAGSFASKLARYESGPWQRYSSEETCPHMAGSREAAFWEILRLHPKALRRRYVQDILKMARR
ncbi:hypothetical protein [Bradyrhizobium septentrionale]|uniref:hypothetical protein n=1 Tax=Bradyrhizobium septentrionale TaxID=1404411 RepID=UPI0030CD33F9